MQETFVRKYVVKNIAITSVIGYIELKNMKVSSTFRAKALRRPSRQRAFAQNVEDTFIFFR